MKVFWMALMVAVLLCGCASEQTLETVADDPAQAVAAVSPRHIDVRLPEGAVAPVLDSTAEKRWPTTRPRLWRRSAPGILMCGCRRGPWPRCWTAPQSRCIIETLSGHSREDLTVMQTSLDGIDRYEFVWAAAGEKGDRLGRGVILDDGSYHYCLSVLRDAEQEGKSQIVWQDVFASFTVV